MKIDNFHTNYYASFLSVFFSVTKSEWVHNPNKFMDCLLQTPKQIFIDFNTKKITSQKNLKTE